MVKRGLGFILDKKTSFFQEEGERGHIEIALRVIEEIGKKQKYETQTKWKDPVDFLVYSIGVLKVGNRWEEKIITYCPYLVTSEIQDIIVEYKKERYKVDEVYEPTTDDDMSSIFRRFR